MPETQEILNFFLSMLDWGIKSVSDENVTSQIVLICISALFGIPLSFLVNKYIRNHYLGSLGIQQKRLVFFQRLLKLSWPLATVVLLLISMAIFEKIGLPSYIIRQCIILGAAWIAISIFGLFIKNRLLYTPIVFVTLIVVALNIFQLLPPVIIFLEKAVISIGELQISVLAILKGIILLYILICVGFWLSAKIEQRLSASTAFTPSVRVLLSKVIKILIIIFICVITLNSLGINLSSLAVLGGAIGLGIGFGLQKVISNLVSGLILLLDKSIKPGDVIQIDDIYGPIMRLSARYVSIVTRDGREYLIPNEDLITGQVINWSFSDKNVRLNIPIGISYTSDLHLAMDLIKETALGTPRVLDDPEPRVLLIGFGDSSVDLQLRFWVNDPENGLSNVRSEILLKIWDKFNAHGISIPYPQRDVHLDILDDSAKDTIKRLRPQKDPSQE